MKPPRIVVIDDSPSSLSLYRRGVEPLEVELQTFLSAYPNLSPSFILDALRRMDMR